ncbi:hypothetical protein PTKIN_Ptkin10aG0025100 [Pterospermum kingtungense]
MVSDLIDHDTRSWKEDLLSAFFSAADAELIRHIPLSPTPTNDCLIWMHSELGQFDVKSAYFVARERNVQSNASLTTRVSYWKFLWNARVLPRIKYFGWRLIHHILPVARSCAVWEDVFPEVFGWLSIWNNRNACYHDGVYILPHVLVMKSSRMVLDFETFHPMVEFEPIQLNISWSAPPVGIHKVNTDASYSISTNSALLGVVVRDCTGSVCVTTAKRVIGVHSVLHYEILSIEYGLQLAHQGSFSHLILKNDCQIAITEILRKDFSFCL